MRWVRSPLPGGTAWGHYPSRSWGTTALRPALPVQTLGTSPRRYTLAPPVLLYKNVCFVGRDYFESTDITLAMVTLHRV